MAFNLSPFGPSVQYEDSSGIPANGYRLFFYAAGSSTKQNTFTDGTGGSANTNPITLNSLGMMPTGCWWQGGLNYKVVYAPPGSDDPPLSPIWTRDSLSGINDVTASGSQWFIFSGTPTYISATQFSLLGDQTSIFQVNRRLQAVVTAGTVTGYISVSSFGAGITEIRGR